MRPSEAKMPTRVEMSEGTEYISEMESRARRMRDAKSGITCRMDTSQQGDPSGYQKSTKENRGSETTATIMRTSIPNDEEEIEERRLLDPVDETRSLMETLMSLGVAQDKAALKVSEIYSPPRVTATARLRPDLNITGLRAFDLNTPHPDGVSGTSASQNTERGQGINVKKTTRIG